MTDEIGTVLQILCKRSRERLLRVENLVDFSFEAFKPFTIRRIEDANRWH
jgi:hypothetical protein